MASTLARIDGIFARLRQPGPGGPDRRGALMPFICGGHPLPGLLDTMLPSLEAGGASIVEIGFPFSDPIADGPVIAAAMHEALMQGSTPLSVLAEVAAARSKTNLGIVAMVSISIVLRIGVRKMVEQAERAGIDGFILPDLPLEESDELIGAIHERGLTASLLIAPSTTAERAERIAKASSGFVYLLARAGITGESQEAPDIGGRVRMLRGITNLPIACGFGISTAEHVRAVVEHADAAIVGSALVRRLGIAHAEGRSAVAEAAMFTSELAKGLR